MTRAWLFTLISLVGCSSQPRKPDPVIMVDAGSPAAISDGGDNGIPFYEKAPAGLFRPIWVEALMPRPKPTNPPYLGGTYTFRLPTRNADALPPPDELDGMWGMRSLTHCGKGYCVDGLIDERTHRTLLAAQPDADERRVSNGNGYVERVIVRADYHDNYASFYLLRSATWPGAHHADNGIECWTFDRTSGRRIDLATVLGADVAKRTLSVANDADINDWIDLGTLPPSGVFGAFRSPNFLLLRSTKSSAREVVLCSNTSFGAGDGQSLQLNADQIPLTFVMKGLH